MYIFIEIFDSKNGPSGKISPDSDTLLMLETKKTSFDWYPSILENFIDLRYYNIRPFNFKPIFGIFLPYAH